MWQGEHKIKNTEFILLVINLSSPIIFQVFAHILTVTYCALPGVRQLNFASGGDLVLHIRALLLPTVLLHLCNQGTHL